MWGLIRFSRKEKKRHRAKCSIYNFLLPTLFETESLLQYGLWHIWRKRNYRDILEDIKHWLFIPFPGRMVRKQKHFRQFHVKAMLIRRNLRTLTRNKKCNWYHAMFVKPDSLRWHIAVQWKVFHVAGIFIQHWK